MRVLWLTLIVIFTFLPSSSLGIKREFTIKRAEMTDARELLGTWEFISDGQLAQLEVTGVDETRAQGVLSFNYNITLGNTFNDSNLIGFIQNGKAYFNITFINGFSFIAVKFNRNFNKGEYSEIFIKDSICDETQLFNFAGTPIYSCIFGTSSIEFVNSGIMIKR